LEQDDLIDRVILLRLGDTAEVIDILGLGLSPESLLELLECEGILLLIVMNQPSVNTVYRVYGTFLVSVPGVGNTDVKFGHVQGCSSGITGVNRLTQGCLWVPRGAWRS
jgi:hypothetical protein